MSTPAMQTGGQRLGVGGGLADRPGWRGRRLTPRAVWAWGRCPTPVTGGCAMGCPVVRGTLGPHPSLQHTWLLLWASDLAAGSVSGPGPVSLPFPPGPSLAKEETGQRVGLRGAREPGQLCTPGPPSGRRRRPRPGPARRRARPRRRGAPAGAARGGRRRRAAAPRPACPGSPGTRPAAAGEGAAA